MMVIKLETKEVCTYTPMCRTNNSNSGFCQGTNPMRNTEFICYIDDERLKESGYKSELDVTGTGQILLG